MLSFFIKLNMLEKVNNHKYREDLYEPIFLKKKFVSIDERDKKIVNEILLFEISLQYGLV